MNEPNVFNNTAAAEYNNNDDVMRILFEISSWLPI